MKQNIFQKLQIFYTKTTTMPKKIIKFYQFSKKYLYIDTDNYELLID